MAYNLIADNTYTVGGVAHKYEILEEGASVTAETLKVEGKDRPPVLSRGEEGPQALMVPHLASMLEMHVKDDGRFLLGRFAGKSGEDFLLRYSIAGAVEFEGPLLLDYDDFELDINNPVIPITAIDGLVGLESQDYDKSGDTTVLDLYRSLLDDIAPDLDLITYLNWAHDNQDGTTPHAQGIRQSAEDWGGEKNAYEVIREMTRFWQAQIVQENGVWRLLERAYRDETMDFVKKDTSDTITTGTDDRTIALSRSDIDKLNHRPSELALDPLPKTESLFEFETKGVENGSFEDWESGEPVGWEDLNSSVARETSGGAGGRVVARHDETQDKLRQHTSLPVRSGESISVNLEVYLNYNTGSGANALEPDIALVKLENTVDGQDYWLDKNGAWQTTETYITSTFSYVSGGDVWYREDFESDGVPSGGTIMLETNFDADGDDDGTNDFDYWQFYWFEFTPHYSSGRRGSRRYFASNSVSTSQETLTESFGIGDYYANENPSLGVLEYKDATSGNWETTDDWDGTGKDVHQLRAERRLNQQSQQLKGLDVLLKPGVDISIADTVTYDGATYVPVYEERNLKDRTRRLVMYELRSASSSATEEDGGTVARPDRPQPSYNVELEYDDSADAFEVYLTAQRDAQTVAVTYEYVVGGSVVNSATVEVGSAEEIRQQVNSGSLLAKTNSATVKAYAWTAYDSGTQDGDGLRQARVWERTVTAPAKAPGVDAGNVSGTLVASQLVKSAQSSASNITFTSDDQDTVSWGSGSFDTADGTSYSITAGGTGNMTAKTYIYLDPDTSTTAFQTSTTFTDALGDNKIIVAIAENGSSSDQNAFFNVIADKISVNGDTISVSNLAAIVADLGKIIAGEAVFGNGTDPTDVAFTGIHIHENGFIKGIASGVTQALFDTDGILKAGADAVKLEADGIRVQEGRGNASEVTWFYIDGSGNEVDFLSLLGTRFASSEDVLEVKDGRLQSARIDITDYAEFTGTTAPGTPDTDEARLWYDATNNVLKYKGDDGTTWTIQTA